MKTPVTNAIDHYTHRPALYEHLDGTADLGLGAWFLMFALGIRLSVGTVMTWRSPAVFCCMFGAVWAIVHFCTQFIRRRLVYRRSGYLEMRKRPWALALVALLAMITAAGSAFRFATASSSGLSAPLLDGLLIGFAMLLGALRQRVKKLAAFATLSVAVGLILQFVEPAFVPGTFWYFLLMGLAFLSNGALTLYLYARRMPPRSLEAEE